VDDDLRLASNGKFQAQAWPLLARTGSEVDAMGLLDQLVQENTAAHGDEGVLPDQQQHTTLRRVVQACTYRSHMPTHPCEERLALGVSPGFMGDRAHRGFDLFDRVHLHDHYSAPGPPERGHCLRIIRRHADHYIRRLGNDRLHVGCEIRTDPVEVRYRTREITESAYPHKLLAGPHRKEGFGDRRGKGHNTRERGVGRLLTPRCSTERAESQGGSQDFSNPGGSVALQHHSVTSHYTLLRVVIWSHAVFRENRYGRKGRRHNQDSPPALYKAPGHHRRHGVSLSYRVCRLRAARSRVHRSRHSRGEAPAKRRTSPPSRQGTQRRGSAPYPQTPAGPGLPVKQQPNPIDEHDYRHNQQHPPLHPGRQETVGEKQVRGVFGSIVLGLVRIHRVTLQTTKIIGRFVHSYQSAN